ncbi:MAG: TatD family hydrolase [Gammaproteobacteria bacterium]|nr:TatD family hydrolase [Gammaproteobacteria bacterium]MCY4211329.1 TatD family hydrolase [Gammaproteobacteria bacterium]MCY4282073.1 TatD family hydrolase [Gammaproteobacteria bacterium]MCY4337517.1 TatD family hydrolase [Gammaproteobacteria bacterium]
MNNSYLVDSHCHIPLIEMEGGAEAVIGAAQAAGVVHLLCVSVDLESFPEIRQLAQSYACVSASVGVHPNSSPNIEPTEEVLLKLAQDPAVIAIGETGLDYYRSEGDLAWQQQRFRTHIRAAREIGKPLIIHSREARGDVINILAEEGAQAVGGVMHCFVEDFETAKQAMDLNFYISFSGIVTFRNARELQEVAKQVPLDRIMVETDSPYLAPVPYRGKQNQPAYVRHVAEKIAELQDLEVAEVIETTTRNFRKVFFNDNHL